MEPLTASDGFAIMMIGIMLLAMAVIASLWFCMRANVARRDRQVDDLLDEVSADEKSRNQVASDEAPPTQPWERDEDWWRK